MTLQELLSADLYAQVETAINTHNAAETDKTKHVRFVDLSEGKYVGKENHDSQIATAKQQAEDLKKQLAQRDTDLTELRTQLTAAQTDAGKIPDLQKQLTDLQSKYEQEGKDYAAKLARQAYEFAVQQRADKLKFSSASARKAFVHEAMEKGFKMDGDTLQGYDEFVTKYKTDDPGAFVQETPPETQPQTQTQPAAPQIVMPTGTGKNAPPANNNPFHFNFVGVRPATGGPGAQ